MNRSLIRPAIAGASAAALWAVAEVPLSRALDTGFTDVGLLGAVQRASGVDSGLPRALASTSSTVPPLEWRSQRSEDAVSALGSLPPRSRAWCCGR